MADTGYAALIGSLGGILTRANCRLATAESCTGGMIATMCTDMPGSSVWFAGGIVAYANGVKQRLLGVREETLLRHGAVSEAVVRQMALGVLDPCGAEVSLAVSGVAGPGGGTMEKPVGTVWTALAVRERAGESALANAVLDALFSGWTREPVAGGTVVTAAWRCRHEGNRAAVRRKTAEQALTMLEELLRRGMS